MNQTLHNNSTTLFNNNICKSEAILNSSNHNSSYHHQLCNNCLKYQDSVRLWMEHLSQAHPLPSEWLSEKAKLLKDDENERPYTVVTDSRKKRRTSNTPRPLNTFMIFSRHIRRNILAVFPDASNSMVSKELGILWKQMTNETKGHYEIEAKRLQRLHQREFPHYKYQPKKRYRPTDQNNNLIQHHRQTTNSTPTGGGGGGGSSSLLNSPTPSSQNQHHHQQIQPRRHNLSGQTPNSPGAASYSSSSGDYNSSYNNNYKKERNSNGSDVENHYIRYSILNKNFVKRECQPFNNTATSKVILGNNSILTQNNTNNTNNNKSSLIDNINILNNQNNSNNNNTFSIIKKEKQIYVNNQNNNNNNCFNNQTQPLNKPLNVLINIDSSSSNILSRPPKFTTSNVYFLSHHHNDSTNNFNNSNLFLNQTQPIGLNNTLTSLFSTIHNRDNNNNIISSTSSAAAASSLLFTKSASKLLPLSNNNNHNNVFNQFNITNNRTIGAGLDLISNHTDDLPTNVSCHSNNSNNCPNSGSNNSTNGIIANCISKDICLINGIYPETSGSQNIDEDIDITGNLFSNDLDVDWELEDGFKSDLPSFQNVFQH